MGFSGNFTGVTVGDDPDVAGAKALFVAGRTDATDAPNAIHIMLPQGAVPQIASVRAPGQTAWEVKFSNGNPPFNVGDEVFVVGVATRDAPHDPFVWEASFKLATKDFL